jgi:hypothetical protein
MELNLNDPSSIVAWWSSHPERHWDHLDFFEERVPQFGPMIRAARVQIRRHPQFSSAFELPKPVPVWMAQDRSDVVLQA